MKFGLNVTIGCFAREKCGKIEDCARDNVGVEVELESGGF